MRQVISTAAEAATKTLPAGDVSLGCGQLRASHIRELNPEVQRTSFISSTICKIPGSPDRPDFSAFAFSAACPTASHMRILHRRGVEPQGRGLGPGSQFTWHIHSVCVCVCACVCVCVSWHGPKVVELCLLCIQRSRYIFTSQHFTYPTFTNALSTDPRSGNPKPNAPNHYTHKTPYPYTPKPLIPIKTDEEHGLRPLLPNDAFKRKPPISI